MKCYKRLIYKQFVQVSMNLWSTVSELFAETFHVPWSTNMAAGNQQKHLEFTFSIKAPSFHSRASIRVHKRIL